MDSWKSKPTPIGEQAMKSKQSITRRLFILVISIAIVVGSLTVLNKYFDNLIESPRGPREFSVWNDYRIDPKTILEKLDQGGQEVFTPVLVTPVDYEKIYQQPFQWMQADYLKIANALHLYIWKEPLEDWLLYDMSFYGDCRYNPVGFDLFKSIFIKYDGARKYTAHEIDIYPLYAGVSVAEETNLEQPMFDLGSVNLNKLKVTVDDALRIAEENGGRNFRLAIKNQCNMSFRISSNNQVWYINYSNQDSSSVFEMSIDPYTEKYKLLNTQ